MNKSPLNISAENYTLNGKSVISNNIDSTMDEVCETVSATISVLDKLRYARKTLNSKQYRIIGAKSISYVGMTIEKIKVLSNHDLSIEQIQAIGGEFLSHQLMTDQKITVIAYMLGVEDIKRIGPKVLAEMTIEELNQIV